MTEFREDQLGDFATLLRVMERLRAPGGCPWDREQTHQSLRPYVLEEAYEVVDAIDRADDAELREELGDLLLQVVFHAQLGREDGRFAIEDVIRGIVTKLIRRHPHVFADVVADTPDAVLRNWHQIKKEEKGNGAAGSIFDGVPDVLPALLKAITYSRRAAQVGFDWNRPEDVISKLHEEVAELEQSLAAGGQEDIEEELGDILFVMANLARHLKVNPEIALERANRKFRDRFRYIEHCLAERGSSPQQSNLEEMDKLWDEAKTKL